MISQRISQLLLGSMMTVVLVTGCGQNDGAPATVKDAEPASPDSTSSDQASTSSNSAQAAAAALAAYFSLGQVPFAKSLHGEEDRGILQPILSRRQCRLTIKGDNLAAPLVGQNIMIQLYISENGALKKVPMFLLTTNPTQVDDENVVLTGDGQGASLGVTLRSRVGGTEITASTPADFALSLDRSADGSLRATIHTHELSGSGLFLPYETTCNLQP